MMLTADEKNELIITFRNDMRNTKIHAPFTCEIGGRTYEMFPNNQIPFEDWPVFTVCKRPKHSEFSYRKRLFEPSRKARQVKDLYQESLQ
jgi:hypothetical protein